MNFQIHPASATFGGRSYAGKDFRFIFVGKNPYSNARIAVYSAGTNALIDGINSRYHGPHSYYVFDGAILLDSGDYDENFNFRKDKLPVTR